MGGKQEPETEREKDVIKKAQRSKGRQEFHLLFEYFLSLLLRLGSLAAELKIALRRGKRSSTGLGKQPSKDTASPGASLTPQESSGAQSV